MPAFRAAYVTGASSGIGAELSRELAARGTRVVLAARRAEELERVLAVNAVGAIATVHAGVERMLPRGRGTLAVVSSLAAYRGLPASGAYSASKACVSTFLETARADLRDAGLRVCDVRPGFVRTPMTADARFPTPFLWDVDRAARRIVRGLERGRAQIAFPWPLWLALGGAQALPSALWRRIAARVRGAGGRGAG